MKPFFRLCLVGAMAALVLCVAGCASRTSSPPPNSARLPDQAVAPGVVYREFARGDPLSPSSDAAVLDVDLRAPGIDVRVAAENTDVYRGRVYADCYTVREWCRRADALGGINGGFFGTLDGERKEVIGLLATDGVVRGSGRMIQSPEHRDRRFVRCVFGLDGAGQPRIGWAVGQRGRGALLTDYAEPLNPTRQSYWKVVSAVACGPRLVAGGQTRVTDRQERLVSPPSVPRTFVAYSLENGRPRHLVLGIGRTMTFQDAAAFVQCYFRETHRTACAEAMCLDGGSSTQLAYRVPTGYADACPAFVTVPTAILITTK